MGGLMTNFKFNISLNVLNHLGRGLYRNFITVIGEAVSNSWDADAKNVWIYINRDKNYFVIKDDGTGMSEEDFRNKFLKIGYSKRKGGSNKTPGGRPYIGNKGIGKLALLSCSKVVSIISLKENEKGGIYVGGVVDNSEIDKAIEENLNADAYSLGKVNYDIFEKYTKNHEKGTIIYFDRFDNGVRNSIDFIRKAIALYFRFSLLDGDFKIHVNDEEITLDDLQKLIGYTEFLWKIEGSNDPYIPKLRENLDTKKNIGKRYNELSAMLKITGFVASVEKPSNLNIFGTGEKVGIDLFVNGRLRETNILRHRSNYATRYVASYLYGQIHYNDLDDGSDRFTTSREGIKPGDEKFEKLLDHIQTCLNQVSKDWDICRNKLRKLGDLEKNFTKEGMAEGLYNVVAGDLVLSGNAMVDKWVDEIGEEAKFNYPSYAECFISENIIRKYIIKNNISILTVENTIINFQEQEEVSKHSGNIYINIRPNNPSMKGLDYLSMDDLVGLLNKDDPNKYAGFLTNAKEYKPFRNAVAHTAILTLEAQKKLNTVYENIKEHIKYILK